MICERCGGNMRAINSRKCKKGVGSNDIPKSVKGLFDDLTYRSWRCEGCRLTTKTIEARLDDILAVAKKAKKEVLLDALKLIQQ